MKILLILFVLLFSSSVVADDDFVIWGAVSSNCLEVQKAMSYNDENDPISMKDFLITSYQGYLSGLNFFVNELSGKYKKLNQHSEDFMFAYVEGYCAENPDEDIATALTTYILTLPDADQ